MKKTFIQFCFFFIFFFLYSFNSSAIIFECENNYSFKADKKDSQTVFFYKKIKTLDLEYKLNTSLDECLLRNNLRKKNVIKTSKEVSDRFLQFQKSKFKVNKTIIIDNNKDIKISVNEIMKNIFIYYHENY